MKEEKETGLSQLKETPMLEGGTLFREKWGKENRARNILIIDGGGGKGKNSIIP